MIIFTISIKKNRKKHYKNSSFSLVLHPKQLVSSIDHRTSGIFRDLCINTKVFITWSFSFLVPHT